MSLHPDAQTLQNIHAAQTVRGIPPEQVMVSYNNLADLLDQRVAQTPDKVYLIHYDTDGNREEFTYAQFNKRVNQVANFLVNAGVRRGQRVATISYNHSDTVIIYFACWKVGAAIAPQNVTEDDNRIGFILKNSEAVICIVRPEYLDRAESIIHGSTPIENIKEIIQVGGESTGKYRLLHEEASHLPTTFQAPEPVTVQDEALLVYTSGTTGAPKGVVQTQYNQLVDADAITRWHEMTADQRTMCVLPIHHVNGILVTLVTPMFFGGSTVLNRAYSSGTFWQRIAAERVQLVSVVPTLLQFSLEYADKAEAEGRSIWGEGVTERDVAPFRHFICGAGTLAVALAVRFEERFNKPIMHGYGLSETTCYTCFLPIDVTGDDHTHWIKDFGYPSIGVPVDINEMAIFDALGAGQQLGPGERGEICIRGHNIMKYYYQRPDSNQETFKFGWFRSGDEGFYELDEHGRQFFFITGRLKELINRGGVKFSPFDIEEVLIELPQVKVGLAIAFENDYYGEEVGAYVVLNEGHELSEQEVIAHCRKRMSFEKSPKAVIFGTEIPVTTTGKYQRLKLQDRFVDHKSTQFRP
jgi:long-chain acyl-CoA synthetase